MNQAVKDVTEEMTRASDEERITFPEVVTALMGAGVERYHADLARAERTYYMPDGASHCVASHAAPAAAQAFAGQAVSDAIGAIQAGKIQYREFCARITAAGCVGYDVFITGRRVVYRGRLGDSHVEYFPGTAP